MEETYVGMDHGDAVVVTRVNDGLIIGGSSRRGNVLYSTLKQKNKEKV